ncbi:MAG: aminotransferase class I/II-fold pyridoxal phosphate-dependent enzyme [Synergistaceae bacterium]|nr:aminotransferase class I/II-fold pyridoxal phosphate-dependent enzyme [Synergistaceae bacterium]
MGKAPADMTEVYFKRLLRTNVLALEGYSPGPPPESEDTVFLGANENCFGTPPAVLRTLRSFLAGKTDVHRYPDVTCSRLRDALSQKHRLPPGYFIVGNGLDDIINTLALTFLEAGDEVIVPAAAFVVYSSSARMMGAVPVFIPMKSDLSIDTDAIADAVTSRTKMIFLCSPNNPTGTVIRRREFDVLLEKLSLMPNRPLLMVDHAYADFIDPAQDHADAMDYVSNYNHIGVLRTFSKISGLAGLRAGYMAAHPNLISYMYRVRPPYTVNTLAQAAALTDAADPSVGLFKEKTRVKISETRGKLENFLRRNGIPYVPSQANFVFAFYGMPYSELLDISQELRRKGILVRTLKHDLAPCGLRFTIGTPVENKKLISALLDIINGRRN